MKFLACYANWGSEDGVFVPPIGGAAMLVNAEYVRAIEQVAPGVSRVFVNLSDHVGCLYIAGNPVDVADRIMEIES